MNQQKFWHETYWDALDADIKVAGGYKVVGHVLWGELDPEEAGKKLRNAVNQDQKQKIDGLQILRIKELARVKGSSATVEFEGQRLSFKPEWIEPEDQAAKLKRLFIEHVARIESIAKEIQRSEELVAQSQRLRAVR